ncbi:MAG: N-acetylmuramoyl-L-alanine amidase, partial [Bacteroidota bacterium]|nr:N-acetylmuramoyl-L-alanine amidase [Bacteroidota bacterium]
METPWLPSHDPEACRAKAVGWKRNGCHWSRWFLLSVLCIIGAYAQQTLTLVLPDEKKTHLPLRAIGSYITVGLYDCTALWHGRARLNRKGTELQAPEGLLQTAPFSFFLRWETPTTSGVYQLPVPVQSDGSQLFVPAAALVEALAILWGASLQWISPTEVHFLRPVANTSTSYSTPSRSPLPIHPPRIPPLPIPQDTGFAPKVPRLPFHEHWDSSAPRSRSAGLLAAVGTSFALAPVEIARIEAQRSSDTLHLRFIANGTIDRYQRPEWQGRELVLRIPDVLHTAETALQVPDIQRLDYQRIRDITVYRIRFRANIRECFWGREGPRVVRLSVLLAIPPPESERWGLDVIVIDPGHGGADYGALSLSGRAEKDITLQIALKLRQLLQRRMP